MGVIGISIFVNGWVAAEREVQLPTVRTLARLMAKLRDDATERVRALEVLLPIGRHYVVDQLPDHVAGSSRRWSSSRPRVAMNASA